MKITSTVDIACTRDRVWRLLTEPERIREWNTDLIRDETLTEGPVGVGTKSRMLIREGAKEVWYDGEILEYQQPEVLTMQLTGGSLGSGPMTIRYGVSGTDGALTVRFDSDWTAHGLVLRLMEPLIALMARRNAKGAMHRLKEVAESAS